MPPQTRSQTKNGASAVKTTNLLKKGCCTLKEHSKTVDHGYPKTHWPFPTKRNYVEPVSPCYSPSYTPCDSPPVDHGYPKTLWPFPTKRNSIVPQDEEDN